MDQNYQVIDRENWKRNLHCQIFQNSLEPQYCISLELNITHFLKMVKANRYSFTFAFIYAVGKCANDVFSFSPLPWISYTHISHTISGNKENASPTFDWGKYFERDGQVILPFSVQVHHSFVDGIHVGRLIEKLQNYLNSF